MIRHICALAALALALSTAACAAEATGGDDVEAEETSQDLVSRSAFFETFQGLDGKFYFNLVAANGQNVLRSQGYTSLASAENGAESVLENGNDKRNFEVLAASNGDYYFNLKAQNGEVIGTSQLYANKSNANRGAVTVRGLVRLSNQAAANTKAAPKNERFEIFTGEDQKFYFRLRAGNGEILLGSQGYTAKASAKGGIASVKANGAATASFEVFEAGEGWGVRLVAGNGEPIARGESYATKSNAQRAVRRMAEILATDVTTKE